VLSVPFFGTLDKETYMVCMARQLRMRDPTRNGDDTGGLKPNRRERAKQFIQQNKGQIAFCAAMISLSLAAVWPWFPWWEIWKYSWPICIDAGVNVGTQG
jgi:hypothetical protein